MPQFTYTAIGENNRRVTGTMEAFSLQSAHDALRQMNLVPEEIHESMPSEQSLTPEHAEKLLAFTPQAPADEESAPPAPTESSTATQQTYFPLLDTLRLYAGWLLAWYCLVYALGHYQHVRPLPFRLPYVEGLFLSPLVLSFTLAAYLFLLFSSLWKTFGRGFVRGAVLTVIGIAAFVLYRMNVL